MKKNIINRINYFIITLAACFFMVSCAKQDQWLDAKSNKAAVVPESVADFQALLANTPVMNGSYSVVGLASSDNFYLTDAGFASTQERERNLYTWNASIWVNGNSAVWNYHYEAIEIANVVLDGLQKMTITGADYNNVRGQALFHRAMNYYNLLMFCKAYNSSSADADLGLPLRLRSDVNIILQRASLSATYRQMIADALQSANLLPSSQLYLQRPTKAAAYALLAKIYLNMGDYVNAANYANLAIKIHPALLDYNNTNAVSFNNTYRFLAAGVNNPEILFYASTSTGNGSGTVNPSTSSTGFIAADLYQSYQNNDLRKSIFYAASGTAFKYRGTYTGDFYNFCGLAINEVYLIRAECYARSGNTAAAIADVNTLLTKRYKNDGSFIGLTAATADDALTIVLQERRKELPFVANVRWDDLRRLNSDVRFQKTLTRIVNGVTYTLSPNDKRYVLPIPLEEIQLSGLQQNDR